MIERELGEEFIYKNKKLKVVESESCTCCYFNYRCTKEDLKFCGKCNTRLDEKSVVFKEI